MVTLTLLAVAALGLSNICAQTRMLSRQSSAQQAAWRLASEMADWLRARGDLPLGGLPEDPSTLLTEQARAISCYATHCSPADAASFFLYDWYRRLYLLLPHAKLVICHDQKGEEDASSKGGWSCANDHQASGITRLKLGWARKNTEDDFPPAILLTILHAK